MEYEDLKDKVEEIAVIADEMGVTLFCVASKEDDDRQIFAGTGTGGEIATLTGLGLVQIIKKISNGDQELATELTVAVAKVVGKVLSESMSEDAVQPEDPEIPEGTFMIENEDKKIN